MTLNPKLTLNTALALTKTTANLIQSSDEHKKKFIYALCEQGQCIELEMTNLVGITVAHLQTYFTDAASNQVDLAKLALIKTLMQSADFMSSLTDELFLKCIDALVKQHTNTNAAHALTLLLDLNPQRLTNPRVLEQVNWILILQPFETQTVAKAALPQPDNAPTTPSMLTTLTSMENNADVFNAISNMNYLSLKAVLVQDLGKTIIHKITRYLSDLSSEEFCASVKKLTEFKLHLLLINFGVWHLFLTKLEKFFQDETLSEMEISTLVHIIKDISQLPVNNVLQLLSSHHLAKYFDNHAVTFNASKSLKRQINEQFKNLLTKNQLSQAIFLLNLMPYGIITKNSITSLMAHPDMACLLNKPLTDKHESYLTEYDLHHTDADSSVVKCKTSTDLLKPCDQLQETAIDLSTPQDNYNTAKLKPTPSPTDSTLDTMCKKLITICSSLRFTSGVAAPISGMYPKADVITKGLYIVSNTMPYFCFVLITAPCYWSGHASPLASGIEAGGLVLHSISLFGHSIANTLAPAIRLPQHAPDFAALRNAHSALPVAGGNLVGGIQAANQGLNQLIVQAQALGPNGGIPVQRGEQLVRLREVNLGNYLQTAVATFAGVFNNAQALEVGINQAQAQAVPIIQAAENFVQHVAQRGPVANNALHSLHTLFNGLEIASNMCNALTAYLAFSHDSGNPPEAPQYPNSVPTPNVVINATSTEEAQPASVTGEAAAPVNGDAQL